VDFSLRLKINKKSKEAITLKAYERKENRRL
jgi:hypothetical protein